MDISNLKLDEIEVECEVRGFSSGSDPNLEKLHGLVSAEQAGSIARPVKMHQKASRRPDLEIAGCSTRLSQLQRDITSLQRVQQEDQPTVARKIQSRLLHVQARLERATHSPQYGTQAKQSLDSCCELIVALEQYLTNPDLLDQSVEAVKAMDIQTIDVTEVTSNNQVDTAKKVENIQDQSELVAVLMAQISLLTNQVKSLSETASVSTPMGQPPSQYPSSQIHQEVVSHVPIGRSSLEHATLPNPVMSSPIANQPNTLNLPSHTLLTQPEANGAQTWSNQTALSTSSYNSDRRSFARCGISYSGSVTGITVDMFLFQLDSVVSSMRMSPEMLLADLHLLLRDVALQWYWTYRRHNPLASWFNLRNSFFERFKDRRTPYEIRRMIESRKQLPQETFSDYYHHMWNLTLQCHTPYGDDEFIQLLLSNMKPALQYHLTDRHFSSINDLLKSCAAWEDTLRRFPSRPDVLAFPRRVVSELPTNLSDESSLPGLYPKVTPPDTSAGYSLATFRGPPGGSGAVENYPNVVTVVDNKSNKTVPNAHHAAGTGGHPVCYNCCDIGHTFKNCPTPPTGYFCYKCGMKDTITPQCPNCTGNRTGGQWRSGNQGPPRVVIPRKSVVDTASNTDGELRRIPAPSVRGQTDPRKAT